MNQHTVNSEGDEKEIFWCIPSKHYLNGVFQYTYYRINEPNKITTPASSNVNIIFVMTGGCRYEGTEVKQGDVFLYGINKNPVTSFSTNIELFAISVNDTLVYEKFGLIPALYHQKALCLPKDHTLSQFAKSLLDVPMEQWVNLSELFLETLFDEQTIDEKQDPYACVLHVVRSRKQKGNLNDIECCKYFGISMRHLQRQFIRFFGITMRDYEKISRFSKAYSNLDENSLTDTALRAGYYDQSHMSREFKKMAGISPQLATQHTMYNSLKQSLKNLKPYLNPDDEVNNTR